MKNAKIKVAVAGYGGQGSWHCRQIEASDVVELGGVFDISADRRAAAAEKGIFVYDSFDDLLSSDVQIVVIATPNDSHKELTIKALEAKKNVICEKPGELSLEALDQMIAAAKKNSKVFTVHHNRRYDVDFLAIKKIIESGQIGDTIRIESRVMGSRGIPSDWRCKKEFGGGMIYDWGVHLIDQMLLLIPDKIERVSCSLTHNTTSEVDDGFRLELFFEGGKSAYIEMGTFNFIALPRFYLQSRKGSALIRDWRENAQVARLKYWTENEAAPVQTAAGISKTMAPRDELTLDLFEIERAQSDVHDFYRNFCSAVEGKAELAVTHRELRRNMKVMEAAFASAALGKPVDFDENK